tara:strand:- start:9163 stop:9765 length:603 start_codon:yes stop_codon:yes gene_type:complete
MTNISDLDDVSLVSNVKNQIQLEECLTELINRHSGIFYKASSNCLAGGQLRNDFFDEKQYFFYSVATKFDESRGCTFPVYLYNMTRWTCMKELTKATKRDKEDPYDPADLDSVMHRDGSEKSPLDDLIFGEDLSIIEDALDKIEDKKARKIIRMRYFEGEGKKPTPFLNLKDEVGLSRWGVIMAHNRGIDKVKKHIKNLI